MWMSSKSINYLKCFLNIMVQVYFFFYYSVSFMPIQPSIRNIIQDKEMWYTRISIGISEETFHFNIFVINKDPIRKSMRSVFYILNSFPTKGEDEFYHLSPSIVTLLIIQSSLRCQVTTTDHCATGICTLYSRGRARLGPWPKGKNIFNFG